LRHRISLRPEAELEGATADAATAPVTPVPAVRDQVELHPVMTLKSRVLQIKRVAAGSGVSYGHTFVAPRESVIGVLAVGYADGYRRGLQHGGEVLVRGPMLQADPSSLMNWSENGLNLAVMGVAWVVFG